MAVNYSSVRGLDPNVPSGWGVAGGFSAEMPPGQTERENHPQKTPSDVHTGARWIERYVIGALGRVILAPKRKK